jgi:hypothetical protein
LIQEAPPFQLVEIPTAPTTTVAATTAPSENNNFKDGKVIIKYEIKINTFLKFDFFKEGCSTHPREITDIYGTINSPVFSKLQNGYKSCFWVIRAPSNQVRFRKKIFDTNSLNRYYFESVNCVDAKMNF